MSILYLGTDPNDERFVHYPVIKIVPRSFDSPHVRAAFEDLKEFTHIVFTSKNAVEVFFDLKSKAIKKI